MPSALDHGAYAKCTSIPGHLYTYELEVRRVLSHAAASISSTDRISCAQAIFEDLVRLVRGFGTLV